MSKDKMTIIKDPDGFSISGDWTVGIDKESLIKYANSYNSSPNEGFMDMDEYDKVVLSHKDCKISMTPEQARKLINSIKEKYQR